MASPRLPRKRKAAAAAASVDAAAWTSSLSSSDTGEDEPPAKKQRKRPAKEQKGEEEATKEPKVQNKTAAATPSPAALGASQPDDGQNLRLMMWRSPTEDVTNGWLAIKCWRELWLAITTLVESHVVDKVKWATLDAATKEKLTSWAPKAKEYLPHAHLSASTQAFRSSPLPSHLLPDRDISINMISGFFTSDSLRQASSKAGSGVSLSMASSRGTIMNAGTAMEPW